MENLSGKKLLILAGASVHCKVVRAAKKLGVHTIVTDYLELEESPAKRMADEGWMYSITDVDSIVERCKQEHVDGILNFCIDPAQLPYQKIAQRLGKPCYGTRYQFDVLTDKRKFKDFCLQCGVDVIPEYTLEDVIRGNVTYPVLVKPTNSRGSRGQTVCHDVDSVYKAVELASEVSTDSGYLIERYMINCPDMAFSYMVINGVPYLVKIGDRYLGKKADNLDRQQISTILPSKNTEAYLSGSDIKVRAMIAKLGLRFGPVFFQGIWSDGHAYMYDPGLRFPGSDFNLAQELATGFDSVSTLIHFALTGDETTSFGEPQGAFNYAGGACVILSIASRPGRIARFIGYEEVAAMPGVVSANLLHNVGDQIPESGDVRQRVAEFVAYIPHRDDIPAFYEHVYRLFKVLDSSGNSMSISEVNVTNPNQERKMK